MLQGQCRSSAEAPAEVIRFGVTCSRKVGNAVARNRAKRRLRAAARQVLPDAGRPGWDYVLVGRAGVTGSCPWPDLLADLATAVSRIHAPGTVSPERRKQTAGAEPASHETIPSGTIEPHG